MILLTKYDIFFTAMKNIVELLKKQVDLNPLDIAIVDEFRSITYKDLYLDVLAKASYLKSLGINKSPIIIKVDRKLDTLLYFYAVLLSNNFYIPVDENIPEEKLNKIIISSGAKYYISSKEDLAITKIDFKEVKEVVSFEEFAKEFDPNNNSYIMYTSGSTGEPKGVIKNHENIISFVNNFLETFPFLGKERIANQTPFFFDASAKDIYLSLAVGATLYIPDKVRFSLPAETIKYLNENKITFLCWVPSILTMIAKTRTLNYLKPEYLKYVFFVGEVFQPKYLNMWIDALPGVRYFNIYGSTEVMGVSLYYEIKKHFEGETIPTGKPVNNNYVYLDDGEIIISSKQVAKGYVNNPTSKSFRFDKDGNLELATGDYATYDKDGNIVFASRKDYQIKHLGYRIELQEIESSLINLDYIDQCAAVYDENSDRIILFVTLNKEVDNPNKTIIADAKEKVQFYMVPNKVIVLDEMPLNNNGKIDRVGLKSRI